MAKRTYYVFHVNCDCASYNTTRSKIPTGHFPRCDFCRRSLGFFQWQFLGTAKAVSKKEAIEQVLAQLTGEGDM